MNLYDIIKELLRIQSRQDTLHQTEMLQAIADSMGDGIRREFFLCLLWRRIDAIDNGSIFIGGDFSGVKLS